MKRLFPFFFFLQIIAPDVAAAAVKNLFSLRVLNGFWVSLGFRIKGGGRVKSTDDSHCWTKGSVFSALRWERGGGLLPIFLKHFSSCFSELFGRQLFLNFLQYP